MSTTPVDLTQRLRDRVAVVTGGASGIGLASARRLAAEGARVVVADLDPETGVAAAEEVGGTFVAVDVSDREQVDALFDSVASSHGSVDIAFNNAGISPPEDDLIESTDLDAWDRCLDINVTSMVLMSRFCIPHMRRRGGGSITISSSKLEAGTS